jgi:uncharacterized protein YndB with AHSA1/START domain
LPERELLHRITIAAPIEAVWAELTRIDGRQRAMMDTVLESALEPGAPLYYKSPDGKRVFIVGRVVEVDPPRRLSHTQRVTTRKDPFTLVTWELEPAGGGTRVTLRHTGWPEDTKKLHQVDGTWAMILPELKRLLEDGDVSRGVKAKYAMYRAFTWALPKSTRTENVPPPPA